MKKAIISIIAFGLVLGITGIVTAAILDDGDTPENGDVIYGPLPEYDWEQRLGIEDIDKRTYTTKDYAHPTDPTKRVIIQSSGLLHYFNDRFHDILPIPFPGGTEIIAEATRHYIMDLPDWGEAKVENDGKQVRVYDEKGQPIYVFKDPIVVEKGTNPYKVVDRNGQTVRETKDKKEGIAPSESIEINDDAISVDFEVENNQLYLKLPVGLNYPVEAYDYTDTSSTEQKNAWIPYEGPNENFGGSPVGKTYQYHYGEYVDRSLQHWILTSGSGNISKITANLYYYLRETSEIVNVYPITQTGWTEYGVTWNCAVDDNNDGDCDIEWPTAGGELGPLIDTFTIPAPGNWVSINLTEPGASGTGLTLDWGDPVHLMYRLNNESAGGETGANFWEKSHGGPLIPYLEIIYTPSPANQPPSFSSPNQYKSIATEDAKIGEGKRTSDSTIVFKAIVSDPDDDQVRLEIELRRVDEFGGNFINAPTASSSFVFSGSTITITISDLINGQYHWQARAVDEKGAVSDWQEFGETGNVDFEVDVRIIPDKAVELAKEVIGTDYLWGGKGYDLPALIKKFLEPQIISNIGYNYWNSCFPEIVNEECKCYDSNRKEYREDCGPYIDQEGECKCRGKIDFGKGLDCSGLNLWSFNRAYYNGRELTKTEFEDRPLYYEGANSQYTGNIDKQLKLTKEDLNPGDLLFFDTWNRSGEAYGQDGIVDHVAMYMGSYDGEQYAVEHAHLGKDNIDNAGKISITTVDGLISYYKTRFGEGAFVDFGRVIDRKIAMKLVGHSPIDLIITAPDGETIYENIGQRETTSELGDIGDSLTMSYMVYDIDGDGELDDIVVSPERKLGEYLITVVVEPSASPTDTYSLEMKSLVNGEMLTTVLAEDVPISEIPRTPYIVESTETEIIPIISAFVDFEPNALNLKSKGNYITVYIELPKGYDVNKINLESIRLNNQVPIEPKLTGIGDYDNNGISDLMVKFNRASVQNILEVADEAKIIITGKMIDENPFKGSDTIKIISEGKKVSVVVPLLAFAGIVGLFIYKRKPEFLNKITKTIKIITNFKRKR